MTFDIKEGINHLYCVFTYIYSLLIKDIYDCQNV